MTQWMKRLQTADWNSVRLSLNENGFARLPRILSVEDCTGLKSLYNQTLLFRKNIVMERYRFGLGEYKYFGYPLPGSIESARHFLYEQLAPLANQWMTDLNLKQHYPPSFSEWLTNCRESGQDKPTVLMLKYGSGGHNTLHQDLYGELFFPVQAVFFLNAPEKDYRGGEFVLTQQIPRAQSKAIVLHPGQGDLLLFTTGFRPVKGLKGFYRVNMKHGVSEVHEGERYTLGIIFHDAEH